MIGDNVVSCGQVTSTNDIARELASGGCQDGTVVTASSQTKGRGRFDREWFSPEGPGIYLSILIKDNIPTGSSPLLSFVSALSVAVTVKNLTGLSPSIKWPNDVLVNSKKIAGILIEKSKGYYIVGIGVNLNNKNGQFPKELSGKASSLLEETGNIYDKDEFLSSLLRSFDLQYNDLINNGAAEIVRRTKEMSATLRSHLKIKTDGAVYEGKVIDIDGSGSLLLELADGKIISIRSGEIL